MYLAEPSNRLVPDLVTTLTIAPCARPYSAPTADVRTRHFLNRFEVQVGAERARRRVGRVDGVDDEQVVAGQRAERVDVAGADDAGRRADERLVAAADRQLFELLAAQARRWRSRVGRRRRSASRRSPARCRSARRSSCRTGRRWSCRSRPGCRSPARSRIPAAWRRSVYMPIGTAGKHVAAVLVGHRRTREPAILAGDRHRDAGQGAAGRVLDLTADRPGLRRLGKRRRRRERRARDQQSSGSES